MGIQLYRSNNSQIGLEGRIRDFIPHLSKKLKRNIKDYGLWISCKKVLGYIFQPLYRKITYYIYELDLNQHISQNNRTCRYNFKMINQDEDNLIDQIEKMEEWLSGSFSEKLRSNCLCMVVLDKDKVIGFNYVSIGEGNIPLLKLKVLIGPTDAWSEQITISAAYRRQGLASALRNNFYKELKTIGITKLYGHRQEFNIASKQSAKRYTRQIMVRAEYRQILGIHRLKCVKIFQSETHNTKRFYLKSNRRQVVKEASHAASMAGGAIFTANIEDIK